MLSVRDVKQLIQLILLTLWHLHWLANVRFSSQFSQNRQPLTAVREFPCHLKRGWIFSIVKETGCWCHILKGTAAPWATCLLCLNSLRGLLLIWFMVTWLVIIYTPLRSYPVAMDDVTGSWMPELAQWWWVAHSAYRRNYSTDRKST